MFEIPGSNIIEVKITESVVIGKDEPEFVRKTEFDNKNDSTEQTEMTIDDGTATRAVNN